MVVSQAEGLEGHGGHGSPQPSRDFTAKLAKLSKTKPGLEVSSLSQLTIFSIKKCCELIRQFQDACKNYKNIKLTRMMGFNISFSYST